jgi:hypothetical protein
LKKQAKEELRRKEKVSLTFGEFLETEFYPVAEATKTWRSVDSGARAGQSQT